MEIWLLRHAEAEDHASSGHDADRHLTAAGRKRMKDIAAGIKTLEPKFDLVLVSPLVRAQETAEPVVQALGLRSQVTPTLVPGAEPRETLAYVVAQKRNTVLLVGHLPHLGRMLGLLVSGQSSFEMAFKKAALARVALVGNPPSAPGELKFFLPPRILETLGG